LNNSRKGHIIFLLITGIAVICLFILDIFIGNTDIPIKQIINILIFDSDDNAAFSFITKELRLPRALTALIAGAGLGIAGMLMQTLFKNPLAGPFILGITSGASLGVSLIVLSGSALFGWFFTYGSLAITLAGIVGSMLVLFLVLAVSLKVRDRVSLLIVGIMLGSFSSAIVNVLQYFSSPESVKAFVIWTLGSLGGVKSDQVPILAILVISGIVLSIFLIKPLNAYLLGENYAKSMGISLIRTNTLIVIATCLIAGTITAFCGPIAFVGIAIPHISRSLLNTSNHRILFPAILLLGAAFILTCDIISQLPGTHISFPLNAITAIFGAPVVISIIVKTKNAGQSFN